MRHITDTQGRSWDVVVGRESWGACYALFIPAASAGERVRQTLLHASTPEAAGLELDALEDSALAALFDRSTPKEP